MADVRLLKRYDLTLASVWARSGADVQSPPSPPAPGDGPAWNRAAPWVRAEAWPPRP